MDGDDEDPLDAGAADADTFDAADGSELTDAEADRDSSLDADLDAGDELDGASDSDVDGATSSPMGYGPRLTADDFAGYLGIEGGDDVLDAVFTATISAPISKLVLVNTDADGNPENSIGHYTFWTTGNPLPDAVPDVTPRTTDLAIHTRIEGTTEPFYIPVLGSTNSVTLDMYVSFYPGSGSPYYRLYVFGIDDELTQIVDFEAQ